MKTLLCLLAIATVSCGVPLSFTANSDGTITITPPKNPVIISKDADGKLIVHELPPATVIPEK